LRPAKPVPIKPTFGGPQSGNNNLNSGYHLETAAGLSARLCRLHGLKMDTGLVLIFDSLCQVRAEYQESSKRIDSAKP
jgi:hypothetical protein